MSRTPKWKLEKMKVKVVFRLQFHATHIPQAGWDKLFVSLIPAGSGKVTAKTSKSHVRNGTCKWADPIYETTRLLQDTKTKQYDEKLYKLVIAMGSSRSGLLGEAIINLADYADASKPSSVTLPLHGCNFGSILHVTVQLLTSKTGFREFEQQSELRQRGLQTTTPQNIHNEPPEKLSAYTGMTNDQIEKVNSKVRFQSESSEIPSLGEVDLTEDYADSAVGIDDSSNTSESLYAEKHDSSTHENESLKSMISGDLGGIPLSHSSHPEKGDPSDHRLLPQGANDWVHGYSSDYSMDNDLVTAYEENNRLRGSLEMAESSILELKLEMSSLQSHAAELGVETQKCCQLLAKETASGEELAKEISVLKSECSKFKDDFQQLKHYESNLYSDGQEIISKSWVHLFQDLQMRWLQGLLIMEDKVNVVQNKAYDRELERDFTFLHPDLEAFQHFLQDLKHDTTEVTSLLNAKLTEQVDVKEIGAVYMPKPVQFVHGDKREAINADQYQYEGINHCLNRPDQESQESYYLDATVALRDTISELQRELEESKTEQDNLTKKLDQMECYYEAFIQELEENQKRILGELQNLRDEHSTCMFTITSCNTQLEKLHEDMNEQLLRFSEERRDIESVNMELEKRVISSETALKRARWSSSIAVGQLQKDLELLSFQVLSMFKTNENFVRQAFAETSPSLYHAFPEESSEAVESSLHNDYVSILQNQYKVRVQDSREQVPGSDVVVSLEKIIEEKKNAKVCDKEVQRDSGNLDTSFRPTTVFESNLHFPDCGNIELKQCQNQNAELKTKLSSAKFLLQDSQRSLHLLERLHRKAETELIEIHSENINLDVFSKVLQEALCEASAGIIIMKDKMEALEQTLKHSTESEELLMLRLQTALEDINTMRMYNDKWSTKYDELTLHNQIVEEKLHRMSNENGILTEKITEYEEMIMEYGSYKHKYEDCTAEKTELLSLLEKETLINCSLQDEVNSLHEELKAIKAAANEQSTINNNLEKTLSFLQGKLKDLRSTMISHDDHINGRFFNAPVVHDIEVKDLMSIVLHLEELQKKSCEKIVKLTREKKDVDEQRDTAQQLLTDMESEMMLMKKKYESDVQEMMNKLGMSTDLVDMLRLDLENVSNKLKISQDSEVSYAEQLKELSSRLSVFEVELQNVTNENRDLAQMILDLECVNEELERTKLTVTDSAREHQALLLSLRSGNEESVHLSNELSILIEKLRCTSDDLNTERSSRVKLEGAIADLTSELSVFEVELQNVANENRDLAQKILSLECVNEELERTKLTVIDSARENEALVLSLQSGNEEYVHLSNELSILVEKLRCIGDDLNSERSSRVKLEGAIAVLSSELSVFEVELQNVTNENRALAQKILALEYVDEELKRTKLAIIDSAQENQALVLSLQSGNEESVHLSNEISILMAKLRCMSEDLNSERSSRIKLEEAIADLTTELKMKDEMLICFDKEKTEVVHLKQLMSDLELEKSKLFHLLSKSEGCLRKADENASSFRLQVSDLEAHLTASQECYLAADVELICTRNQFKSRMWELVRQLESLDGCYRELHLKHLGVLTTVNGRISTEAKYVEENARLLTVIDSLRSELEVNVNEKNALVNKNIVLCTELEKYKNKEALAEHSDIQNNQQQEHEIQQLKHLLLSSEELIDDLLSSSSELEITIIVLRVKLEEQLVVMLSLEECGNEVVMLQNQKSALSQRLSEQILKTEEFKNLSIHLKELQDKADAECLEARGKREIEVPSIALQESLRMAFIREQCETKVQELRNQLYVSQKHGEEMLLKLQDSVNEVENRRKGEASHIKRNEELLTKIVELETELQTVLADKWDKVNDFDKLKAELECSLISLDCCKEEKQKLEASLQECIQEKTKLAVELELVKESPKNSAPPCEAVTRDVPTKEGHTSKSGVGVSRQIVINQEDLRQLSLINEHFKAQNLKSSMEHLHEELERMKTENLVSLPIDVDQFEPVFRGLQRQILQLQKANEQLGSIFPLFNDFAGSGNALERVLALEIELAESLQAKKKSNINFQSSFLKQHADEEAVFQSFRDINELIKDMLEMKGKLVAVESELKEMHERYSQLSLQFAEVEGERQKLVMTLKNARSPKKTTTSHLQRSTSANIDDHPNQKDPRDRI